MSKVRTRLQPVVEKAFKLKVLFQPFLSHFSEACQKKSQRFQLRDSGVRSTPSSTTTSSDRLSNLEYLLSHFSAISQKPVKRIPEIPAPGFWCEKYSVEYSCIVGQPAFLHLTQTGEMQRLFIPRKGETNQATTTQPNQRITTASSWTTNVVNLNGVTGVCIALVEPHPTSEP